MPLKLRYRLRPSILWTTPLEALLNMLELVVPILLKSKESEVVEVWNELGQTVEDFLFAEM